MIRFICFVWLVVLWFYASDRTLSALYGCTAVILLCLPSRDSE